MELGIAVGAVVAGYLIGSVSFARLILRAKGVSAETITIPTGGDVDFVSETISATTVGDQVGYRLGMVAVFLDIAKPIVAMLGALFLLPDGNYYLLAGIATMIGHNFPVYHRFKGGRGESQVVGTFLVADPIGFVIVQVVGMVFGIAVGRILVTRWTGHVLMIPWLFVFQGVPEGLFSLVVHAIFWFSLYRELSQLRKFAVDGTSPTDQDLANTMGMGSFWRAVSPYSVPALLARRRTAG